MKTVRTILIDNLRDRRQPGNVSELSRKSGVARETINKMKDGDYGNVRVSSITRAFAALGYEVEIVIKS